MTVKLNANDSVLLAQTFCSDKNFYTDLVLADSINNFYTRYTSDTTMVERRDSIYSSNIIRNLDPGAAGQYVKSGYDCACFR